MDFTKGYTASFYAAFVDPETWQDGERLEITAGSISRTSEGLRASAELTARKYDEPVDRYIRIYMDCDQNGDRAHVPLFTGIASTPGEDHSGAVSDVKLTAYSPLKAAEDIKLPLGYYVPAGMNGETAIRKLLKTQKAPVTADGIAPALQENIIAEQNEDGVTMTEKILQAINWRMQIAGDGTILLSEKQPDAQPKETLGKNGADIVETQFQHGRDWFSCPNVLRVTSGDMEYTERDEDPNDPLSIPSRGREVQAAEDNVTLAENEGVVQYTKRRLKELQQITETASYTRRFMPDLLTEDTVGLDYPDIQGSFEITSQHITLAPGAPTQEDVKRTITLKQRERISVMALIKLPDGYYFVMPDGNRITVPLRYFA